MKLLLQMIFVTTTLAASSTLAFSPDHLKKLKDTNQCVNCDLVHADLTGAKLTGANLSRANLNFSKLSNVNLNDAKLIGAKLTLAE